ncbi:MAG: chemotaxis protein CheA [Arenibacterium sp.]
MSSANDIRQTFFQECDELLEQLDDGLNEIADGLGDGSFDMETVNAVFRSVHSIKGGAAAFGLDQLVGFAHQFETVLDALRASELAISEDVMKICHRSADQLHDLVAAGRDNFDLSDDGINPLKQKLIELVSDTHVSSSQPSLPDVDLGNSSELSFEPMGIDLDFSVSNAPPSGIPTKSLFKIMFRPRDSLYLSGNDTAFLFRELAELGSLTTLCNSEDLPAFHDLNLTGAYLSWELTLETEETEQSVREVFEFVDGLCELDVTQQHMEPNESSEVVAPELAPGLKPNFETEASDILEKRPDRRSENEAKTTETKRSGPKATVRVDLELVDKLINMVGELVINQAVLAQCISDAGIQDRGDLATSLAEFRNLARDIQESVMAIRAQSVKPLFQRMARIVREASELSGKDVELVSEGETTEVDKTIIERLVDPLTHMIRNSVDHGLETPDLREAAGKQRKGRVTLSAAHRSGRVLIEVTDDGAGINRSKVFQIAAEKGLISPDASLKDTEIDNLLFLPGFSTAKEVSNLSGRGVGMDVVKSSIQKLGGRVSILSTPGKGTTMSISLPLTLAVLDGMVVDVAGQTMVIPITAIVETLQPKASDIHQLGSDNTVVTVRNSLLPVVDLGVVFGHRQAPAPVSQMVLLLVESDNAKRWALAVDKIFDQRQVVIKGLETNYGHVPGVAAATILGDGNIALIIDPEETAYHSGAPYSMDEAHDLEDV